MAKISTAYQSTMNLTKKYDYSIIYAIEKKTHIPEFAFLKKINWKFDDQWSIWIVAFDWLIDCCHICFKSKQLRKTFIYSSNPTLSPEWNRQINYAVRNSAKLYDFYSFHYIFCFIPFRSPIRRTGKLVRSHWHDVWSCKRVRLDREPRIQGE